MTSPNTNWALIIHADSSGERIDVYWADLDAGRIGLRLADEVKQWRRRDDLLTIGRRLRIATPSDNPDRCPHGEPSHEQCLICEGENPESFADATKELEPVPDRTGGVEGSAAPPPPGLAEGPSEPVERRSLDARHEYLAGRVRAILGHSDTASKALARAWPEGIPGLKHEGHTWEQLDEIQRAVEQIEKDHSVPFYPEFVDPNIEVAKSEHPSNVWAKPREAKATPEQRNTILDAITAHPRAGLLRRWIGYAINGGIDHSIDTAALAHALTEFANLDESEWPDDDLTVMLDGSLRALGYLNGCDELGKFNPEHAPLLMSAAFAITAGNAYLLFDENEKPVVRTNVQKG
jgi:hypothetical protein